MLIRVRTPDGLEYEAVGESEAELASTFAIMKRVVSAETLSETAGPTAAKGVKSSPSNGAAIGGSRKSSPPVGQVASPTGKSQAQFVEEALRTLGKPGNAAEIEPFVSAEFVSNSKDNRAATVRGILSVDKRFIRVAKGVYTIQGL